MMFNAMDNGPCIFCGVSPERVVIENDLAFVVRDQFPVTPLHSLVIPKRHTPDYFTLTSTELLACDSLIHRLKMSTEREDPLVEGFNIGINAGAVAGQTLFHCHIHVIPRRRGDVKNPRGGVRHLIPGKGEY